MSAASAEYSGTAARVSGVTWRAMLPHSFRSSGVRLRTRPRAGRVLPVIAIVPEQAEKTAPSEAASFPTVAGSDPEQSCAGGEVAGALPYP